MKRLTMQEKCDRLRSYEEKGIMHVSPTEAARLLDCVPYTINLTARQGGYPEWAYRWHGRNCRINVAWLECQIMPRITDQTEAIKKTADAATSTEQR